jgi:thiamine-phosphate pyrophosphorylase
MVGENETINYLFQNGLDFYHLRKPNWNKEDFANFTKEFDSFIQKKIVCHFPEKIGDCLIHHSVQNKKKEGQFHSCSDHRLEEVLESQKNYENLFWSPVFDSISKDNYSANESIDLEKIPSKLRKRIIALGGVEPSKFKELKERGFSQIAIKGWFWNQKDYKKAWQEIQNRWQELERK